MSHLDPAAWKAAWAAKWDAAAPTWRAGAVSPRPELVAMFHDPVRHEIERRLACPPGSLLLDAGCGAGYWTVALARMGYVLQGVDRSPRMIAEAASHAREQGIPTLATRLHVGDLEALAFPEATFDGIVCITVLDFLPRPGVALQEFCRVLKPGRRLHLVTLAPNSGVKRNAWRRFLPDGTATGPVNNGVQPWDLDGLLGALGWQIVEQAPFIDPAVVASDLTAAIEQMGASPSDRLRHTSHLLQPAAASMWLHVALRPLA